MLGTEHKELVDRAERWLLKTCGCGFVLSELVSNNEEIPDAIGFRDGFSVLIECKTSRSDFMADKRKRFRVDPSQGMGAFRFYLCPEGVIHPEDLPERWGLLWLTSKGKVKRISGPRGNAWRYAGKEYYFLERNRDAEIRLMCSALRRLHLRGFLPLIYDGVIGPQSVVFSGGDG